jgi:hypothetical protein
LGWGFSAGLVGCDEQAAISAIAGIAISSFFIATFLSCTIACILEYSGSFWVGFILAAVDSAGRVEIVFMAAHLARLKKSIESAIQGMNADDLSRHAEGKWSVAEILEHLYLSYTGTTKGFERCLAAEKPLATSSTPMQQLKVLLVIGIGKFPPGRKAPKNTQPRGIPKDKIIADIGPQIMAMEEMIDKCEERYGKKTKLIDHPILGPFTAQQWRKFHWVHGRHHVKQILRLQKTN